MRLLVITVTGSVLTETGKQSRMHCTVYIKIIFADCIMQCTMQSHAHSVSTKNNSVLMISLLIGWR